MSQEHMLTALSPLDGRYAKHCLELQKIASEYGLNYYRLLVEISWLQTLSTIPEIEEVPEFSIDANTVLQKMVDEYSVQSAMHIKAIEQTTNHDVKAVEYFIKEKMAAQAELNPIKEFVHFACTSEDINNLAYGLMLSDIREKVLAAQFTTLLTQLDCFIQAHASTAMLARTHGQPASPTTLGKEFANVKARLQKQIDQFKTLTLTGKINGAVGNFNAHQIAYPLVDWENIAKNFVEQLGLQYNPLTTQIEPHDDLAVFFHCLMRINTILIDFCRDIWSYIAIGYFTQKTVATEIGSSTMPHKVNPIDFENAEGNFGLANALFGHFAEKLPISRWQRDLTDSTVLRNIGSACGYQLIALKSLQKGLSKLEVDANKIAADLNDNWEVLAEAIQTVMRRYGVSNPYEKLKELTRGKKLSQAAMQAFVEGLEVPKDVKAQLKALTPSGYIGIAKELSR